MKTSLLIILMASLCTVSNCQIRLLLKPDETSGKDVYLRSLSPNDNFGNHPDFSAHAWTNQSKEVIVRSLLAFDLSSLPDNAEIISAKLSLFSYRSNANGAHSRRSGSNAATIQRVISSWNESTVTWNSQPETTNENTITLIASQNEIQDYLDIDVSRIMQDALSDGDRELSVLIKLINEDYYRKMLFASSDNPNSDLHPSLEIVYEDKNGSCPTEEIKNGINIFPNPSIDKPIHLNLNFPECNTLNFKLTIYDSLGRNLFKDQSLSMENIVDLNEVSAGLYYLNVYSTDENLEHTFKLLKL